MTDRAIADAARAAELGRMLDLYPGEIAAAIGMADGQAAAIGALGSWSTSSPRLRTVVDGAADRGADDGAAPWTPGRARHDGEGGGEPHCWSLARIAAGFASGSTAPTALLEALLARIAAIDGRLNSFVHLDPDGARAAARASARRWAAGEPLGPLDGVPIGIKDVIDVAGMPTRCHSRTTSDAAVPRDAAIVGRLRAAGAVIVGKLATHEFAIGGPAFDLPFPPARNPWNLGRHPGGSSSGGGAAVAAGLVPLAIGTDTAGSVRNPASACGVVGLKPGLGVLPVEGVVPLARTLDHVGLLTRDVADMRIAAGALGVPLRQPDRRPFASPFGWDGSGRSAGDAIGRIGYVRHFHMRDMAATAEVAVALDRVAAALGAVEVTLPPLADFALVNRVILQAEGFAAHGFRLRDTPDALSRLTRAALLPGAFLSGETLIAVYRYRDVLVRAVDAVFEGADILVTASSMEPACPIDDAAEIARTYMLQARSPFNVTGHPALAMMAGLSASGLPLSVQFVARKGEEGRLLAAAAAWERAMGGAVAPPIGPGTP